MSSDNFLLSSGANKVSIDVIVPQPVSAKSIIFHHICIRIDDGTTFSRAAGSRQPHLPTGKKRPLLISAPSRASSELPVNREVGLRACSAFSVAIPMVSQSTSDDLAASEIDYVHEKSRCIDIQFPRRTKRRLLLERMNDFNMQLHFLLA